MLGFVEEALDEVALFVDVAVVGGNADARFAGGDHGLGVGGIDGGAKVICAVSRVGEHMPCRQGGDEVVRLGDIVCLARRKDEAQGIAQRIDGDMKFAG